jgi:SpoIID/LytB domain protein
MAEAKGIPVVKVGIMTGREIRLKLHGNYLLDQDDAPVSGTLVARMDNGKISLENGSWSGIYGEIQLVPQLPGSSFFSLSDVTIGIGFHWQKKENQAFGGTLKLVPGPEGITAINIIPVEDYLQSVISSEMSATSSSEMLKAHAVISRSWLLAQIEKGVNLKSKVKQYLSAFTSEEEIIRWYDREDHTGFDVCADDHCQRYQGKTRASTPEVIHAVKQTEGEVLISDRQLCDTRFSKCCGGITEQFENVWEPISHTYLQRVYDNDDKIADTAGDLRREEYAREWILSSPLAFCNTLDKQILSQVLNDYDQTTHDFYRWAVSYTAVELGELIRSKTGIDFGIILDLIPVERGVSGRLIKLRITGSKKSMMIGKELEIRKALSPTHLYSSAFIIEKTGQGSEGVFQLYGAGWGHGVGLCQIGAAVMGAKGYGYREILLHYFRGAEVKRLY